MKSIFIIVNSILNIVFACIYIHFIITNHNLKKPHIIPINIDRDRENSAFLVKRFTTMYVVILYGIWLSTTILIIINDPSRSSATYIETTRCYIHVRMYTYVCTVCTYIWSWDAQCCDLGGESISIIDAPNLTWKLRRLECCHVQGHLLLANIDFVSVQCARCGISIYWTVTRGTSRSWKVLPEMIASSTLLRGNDRREI